MFKTKYLLIIAIVALCILIMGISLLYKHMFSIIRYIISWQFEKGAYHSDLLSANLKYRYFTPKTELDRKYPLILVLHGTGGRGDDNISQINRLVLFFSNSNTQKKHPAYIMAPQCPKGTQWVNTTFESTPYKHYNQDSIPESTEMKMIIELINQFIKEDSIDTSRIYIIGYSMGASGTWDIITRYPSLFAAAIPITGVSDTNQAKKILDIPIWTFSGENDDIAPAQLNNEMCNAINNLGGNCRYTLFKNVGHDIVKETLKTKGLLEWLFSQRKFDKN